MSAPVRGGVFVSEDVLFWAFRYALGRQTYAVGDVAKGIVASVGSMTAGTARRIRQEIEEADRDGALGSACDEREWKWVHHKLAEAILADGAALTAPSDFERSDQTTASESSRALPTLPVDVSGDREDK